MAVADLTDWMNENGRPGSVWYVKRLAANDTLANDTHQAGPYIPKEFLFKVFPALDRPEATNPDVRFALYLDSHSDHRTARAVWYNNSLRGGTRNEARVTNLGGSHSALLDPDSTGTIAIFVFLAANDGGPRECHVWVSHNAVEDDIIEERVGPVDPKLHVIWEPGGLPGSLFEIHQEPQRATCWLKPSEIPPTWLQKFPRGVDIIEKTLELRKLDGIEIDLRLIKRRECEFEIFQSVEEAFYLPRIKEGFISVQSFVGVAQTILQSRKSRAGNSLELHARQIMEEEGLRPDSDFAHKPVIEGGKRPDFLFPSRAAYNDKAFPVEKLRMLGAKTTCKDRWRQVINEADRIGEKHLLTLQEGVSAGQFQEMNEAGVRLVVPQGLHRSYPDSVRPHLITFESFLAEVRLLNLANKS